MTSALSAIVLWGASLGAQKPASKPAASAKPTPASNRSGQWLGVGLGSGWGRFSCEAVCEANRGAAISGYFRVGGTLSQKFLLGVETDGWMRGVEEVDHMMLGVAAQLFFYPNPRKRLYYKAGVGVLFYQASDDEGRVTTQAFGPNLGAGYDVPISGSVSLTPFASVFIASLGGDINFNGEQLRSDGGLMLVQLGMGLTWH
jgi:hypothetical protein